MKLSEQLSEIISDFIYEYRTKNMPFVIDRNIKKLMKLKNDLVRLEEAADRLLHLKIHHLGVANNDDLPPAA